MQKVEIQLHVYYYQVIITSHKFALTLGASVIFLVSEKFSWAYLFQIALLKSFDHLYKWHSCKLRLGFFIP